MVLLDLASDVPFYIAAALIGPAFVALGVLMIRRPADAIRGIWFMRTKPPRDFELRYMRAFGLVWLAFSLLWCVGVLATLIDAWLWG